MKVFVGAIAFIAVFAFSAGNAIPKDRNKDAPAHGKVVMCPVFTDSVLTERNIPFKLDNADLNLCTHLISLDTSAVRSSAPWSEGSKVTAKDYKLLTRWRPAFPHLKILLGVQMKTAEYKLLATYPEDHQKFLLNSHNFVAQTEMDGMNLEIKDLEQSKITAQDFNKIVSFLRALKEKFDRSNLLLTISIPVSKLFLESGYDFVALSKTIDFISFIQMVNDDELDEHTIPDEESVRNTLTVKENVEALIESGVPADKISIGLNLQGSQFTIDAEKEDKPSKFEKLIAYYDTCSLLSDETGSEWKRTFFDKSDVAILNNDNEHRSIVFDSSRTLANKVRFATKLGLAGAITSPINQDDFLGRCVEDTETFVDFVPENGVKLHIPRRNAVTFPLLRTINEAFVVTLDEIRQEKKTASSASKDSDWESDLDSKSDDESDSESGTDKDDKDDDNEDDEDDKESKDEAEEKEKEKEEAEEGDEPNAKPPQKPSNAGQTASNATNSNSTTQGNGNGGAAHFTYNSYCMILVMVVAFITSLSF